MRGRRKTDNPLRSKYDATEFVYVRGAPFTFRTLHAPDARRDPTCDEHTLDRRITVTMPLVRACGGYDEQTCEVTL